MTGASFEFMQGDDVTLEMTAIRRGTSAPINITDAEEIEIVIFAEDGSQLINKKLSENQIVIISGAAGRYNVAVDKIDTKPVSGDAIKGTFRYEARILDIDGKETTLRESDLSIPFVTILPDLIT